MNSILKGDKGIKGKQVTEAISPLAERERNMELALKQAGRKELKCWQVIKTKDRLRRSLRMPGSLRHRRRCPLALSSSPSFPLCAGQKTVPYTGAWVLSRSRPVAGGEGLEKVQVQDPELDTKQRNVTTEKEARKSPEPRAFRSFAVRSSS